MNTSIFKNLTNPVIITVMVILFAILITVIVLSLKSYKTSDISKSLKARALIADTTALPVGAKPWCTDLIYTFTVSGATGETTLMVPKSMTATFPRIKLTDNGNPIKDGTVINVKRNILLPGVAGALTPSGLPISSYSIKKGDFVLDKYRLDADGVFTDYENPCQTDFQLGLESPASPLRPQLKLIADINITDKPQYAINEYTVTFFTRSNLSGPPVKQKYIPAPSVRANGTIEYFKPVFELFNFYGIDGLRIERNDKVLKEQYKSYDTTQIDLIKLSDASYKLVDKNPLQLPSLPSSNIKAMFSNFNNSFI